MHIGITGAKGVLGKILASKLIDFGCKVFPFEGDVRDRNSLKEWIRKGYDAIFHLAAVVPVNLVEANPLRAYSVNVGGTINILEEVSSLENIPWLFYASSCHVYKSSDVPLAENSPVCPVTLYGETKWMAERICFNSYKSNNIPICMGRIFSFYHDTQKKPYLYPTIKERLANEDLALPFELKGADSIRDFLNAEEVVDILLKLMDKKAVGVVNIASGRGIKVKDFVQQFSENELNIINTDDNVNILVADTSRLTSIIGG